MRKIRDGLKRERQRGSLHRNLRKKHVNSRKAVGGSVALRRCSSNNIHLTLFELYVFEVGYREERS